LLVEMGSCQLLPGLASNWDLPNLHLPCTCITGSHRCEPSWLALSCVFLMPLFPSFWIWCHLTCSPISCFSYSWSYT
jgi:hypothetical protein